MWILYRGVFIYLFDVADLRSFNQIFQYRSCLSRPRRNIFIVSDTYLRYRYMLIACVWPGVGRMGMGYVDDFSDLFVRILVKFRLERPRYSHRDTYCTYRCIQLQVLKNQVHINITSISKYHTIFI